MTQPFTPVPNWLIEAMPQMDASTFMVCMAVARQTYGYSDGNGGRREWGKISLADLEKMTGLSRQGVINALESASGKWLQRQRAGQSWEYKLVNSVDYLGAELVNSVDYLEPTSQLSRLEVVNSVDYLGDHYIEVKKEIKTTTTSSSGGGELGRDADPDFAAVCQTYEKEIGLLSPMASEELQDMVDTYPVQQIVDAIKVAVRANARKLAYVQGVLKRWQTDGYQPMQKMTPNEPTYREVLVPVD